MESGDVSREKLTLSVAEVAKELSCSKVLVYQLIRERRIFAVRLSKRRLVVPMKALVALLEAKSDSSTR